MSWVLYRFTNNVAMLTLNTINIQSATCNLGTIKALALLDHLLNIQSLLNGISSRAVIIEYNMPVLNKNLLLFHPTTVEDVRREYSLDKAGMMDQAIDILYEWIQKQEHFGKKDFCREYLERVIISTKGSVERAKVRVDKICTLRTMAPELFTKVNVKQELPDLSQWYLNVYMPKLTDDHYRIFVVQIKNNITSSIFVNAYKHNIIFAEYLKRNDYANGIIIVIDVRDCNIMDLVTQMNFVDLHKITAIYMEGFGFRIKNLFIISESKVIHLFSNVLRRVLSAKLGERITGLKTVEDLHDHLPKELLPEDFGGQQKSLKKLYDEWTEELSSESHVAYVKEMKEACTEESRRLSDQVNDDYLGMPGSFKILTVD